MDQLVSIPFGSRLVPLNFSTLQAWFPVWGDVLHGQVDANPLIEYIAQRIAGRIPGVNTYNSSQEVEREVHLLFEELSPRHTRDFGEESKKQRVVEMLYSCLNSEMYAPLDPTLPRSRSRFLILCLVANQTTSTRLAEALLQFYNTRVLHVVGSDNSTALYEWNMALDELRDLIPTDALDSARRYATGPGNRMSDRFQRPGIHDPRAAGLMDFAYGTRRNPFVDEYHGRSGLGVPMGASWSSCGSSLSPALHQFKSVLLFEIPPYAYSNLNTSLRASSSLDEVDRLQIRQAELAGEVNGMRRHIELMRRGW
jgi:hypothetical protein